ncbi:hypothetical protein [Kineococcus indalonis]
MTSGRHRVDTAVLAAGTPHTVVPLAFTDLLVLTGGGTTVRVARE